MEDKLLQILLSNIINNGSINSLLEYGLDFKEIAQLTDFAINNQYIIVSNKEIVLSELGMEKLQTLRKDHKNIPKKDWISIEKKSLKIIYFYQEKTSCHSQL
jgi:hypothetical protein